MVYHRITPINTPPDSPPHHRRAFEKKQDRSHFRLIPPLFLAFSIYFLLSNSVPTPPFLQDVTTQHHHTPATPPQQNLPVNPVQLPLTRLPHSQVLSQVQLWKDPQYAKSKLRIYYYDLPVEFNTWLVQESHRHPPSIRDKLCDESFYSAEYSLSQYLRNSAIRTENASEADYFYVPILSTCYRMIYRPFDPVKNGAWFKRAMDIVINEYPYWNRTDGRDHLFMFAQGAGAKLAGNEWHRYRQATFLVHNGDYDESHFDVHKDIVIPPDLTHRVKPVWKTHDKPLQKKWFAQFGGQVLSMTISDYRGSNYSGGVRQYIGHKLRHKEGYRITGVYTNSYNEDMKRSRFCLAPTGWHKWTPRPAYAVLLGCVPVVISEKQMLFFENLLKWEDLSVWVKPGDIQNLDAKLKQVSNAQVGKRLWEMKRVWPLLWYGEGGLAKEAILYSLWRKLPSVTTKRAYL